jgi:hypothetical protein
MSNCSATEAGTKSMLYSFAFSTIAGNTKIAPGTASMEAKVVALTNSTAFLLAAVVFCLNNSLYFFHCGLGFCWSLWNRLEEVSCHVEKVLRCFECCHNMSFSAIVATLLMLTLSYHKHSVVCIVTIFMLRRNKSTTNVVFLASFTS